MSGAPLKVLIVDDEPLARRGLERALTRHVDVRALPSCGDPQEAVTRLRAGGVDLVLLDVEMPELSGFDVIEAVGPEHMPRVVFVTAYDQHAVRAFEAEALDYLLKPLDETRLAAALDRARRSLGRAPAAHDAASLETLLHGRLSSHDRVVLRESGRVSFVPVAEITRLEAADNYVRVHTVAREHLVRGALKEWAARLPDAAFVRIHRSVVVAVSAVREVRAAQHGNAEIELRDGTQLTASRRYREAWSRLLR
ncbi:MAG: DNA-binding response regulator [Planctomycetota bacterium]|nr:MAG: DNA-binding response regulator [Planctomycetota bacterium]